MKKIAIRGSAYAVGQQLGAFGREAWQTKIRQTALWQTVTALKTAEQTQRMRAAVQAQFPLIWQELEGMTSSSGTWWRNLSRSFSSISADW